MSSDGAVCNGRHYLTKFFCTNITDGVNARDVCFCRFFGNDVWLKSKRVNEEKWNCFIDGWKLFTDVKTKEEINYIKENNGIIIRTIRPLHRKAVEGITNTQNADSDFIIHCDSFFQIGFTGESIP